MKEFNDTMVHVMGNGMCLRQNIYNSSLLQVDRLEDIVYENMSIPLYSGLAVMIYLDKLFEDHGLRQIDVDLWSMHFSGDQNIWWEAEDNLSRREGKLTLTGYSGLHNHLL